MEEAECNRRGESKILTVFRLFIIEFLLAALSPQAFLSE